MQYTIIAVLALAAAAIAGPAESCPPQTEKTPATFIPDNSDCGVFYICDRNGQAVKYDCPTGLGYNAATKICEQNGCKRS
ncbi:hypothetical protein BZA77DRAFT_160194 [Pyronema omphalodes]|nr:hypothetical protein BZA77DRAFT_160194 [Pyronema omphalodes]